MRKKWFILFIDRVLLLGIDAFSCSIAVECGLETVEQLFMALIDWIFMCMRNSRKSSTMNQIIIRQVVIWFYFKDKKLLRMRASELQLRLNIYITTTKFYQFYKLVFPLNPKAFYY